MTLGEADMRAKLIDPALHARGWTEDLIRREETAGAVEVVEGQPRRRAKGRVDYTLRVRVNPASQPVAVALIEAKAEHLPPAHGLEQAKAYAACRRLNTQFVFSSNGHLFVEYDRVSGLTGPVRSLAEFPTPAELRARYEGAVGFSLASPAARPLLARYPGGEGPAATTRTRPSAPCWRSWRAVRSGPSCHWRRARGRPSSPYTSSGASPMQASSGGRCSSATGTN